MPCWYGRSTSRSKRSTCLLASRIARRPFGRTAAVRGGRLPGHRDEDDERLRFRMGKAENAGAGLRRGVRIEGHPRGLAQSTPPLPLSDVADMF